MYSILEGIEGFRNSRKDVFEKVEVNVDASAYYFSEFRMEIDVYDMYMWDMVMVAILRNSAGDGCRWLVGGYIRRTLEERRCRDSDSATPLGS